MTRRVEQGGFTSGRRRTLGGPINANALMSVVIYPHDSPGPEFFLHSRYANYAYYKGSFCKILILPDYTK